MGGGVKGVKMSCAGWHSGEDLVVMVTMIKTIDTCAIHIVKRSNIACVVTKCGEQLCSAFGFNSVETFSPRAVSPPRLLSGAVRDGLRVVVEWSFVRLGDPQAAVPSLPLPRGDQVPVRIPPPTYATQATEN